MTGLGKSIGATLLVLVLFTGCSAKKTPPSPTTIPFPTGSFINDDWSWEFKADGNFVSSGPLGSESGTYSASADQVAVLQR